MSRPFADRTDAGRRLAGRLTQLAGRPRLIVLGLPRGGVPVAAEVAEALAAPLDIFVVRKLGVPGQEEFAMGAVASGGTRVLDRDTVSALGIPEAVVEQVTERERRELRRREEAYRGDRPMPALDGANVVLVDDGVATGSSMIAAIRAIRQLRPAAIVAAAPVMSRSAYAVLAREADGCVAVMIPDSFPGVGAFYEDFSQTTDAEVLSQLQQGHRPGTPGIPAASRTGG
jgi:putative phosphoribosyl transferase